jgi:HSP20 family protein
MDWKKVAPWNWFKNEEEPDRSARLHPGERSRDAFERLIDEALQRPTTRWPARGGRTSGIEMPLRPHVDISEGKKAYSIRVELPGIDREDMSITVEGQSLTIRAEKRRDREEEDEGVHWAESSYGLVQRMLSLPDDADGEAIDARFRNGVLKLKLPKRVASAHSGKHIEIQEG